MTALRWPKHPKGAHVRTCQECGHTQVNKDPATMKSDSWRETKCRRCKSQALDFGCTNLEEDEEETFTVRVNQKRGKPAPIVGDRAEWYPFYFQVLEVLEGPVVSRFRELEFDNYKLQVKVERVVPPATVKTYRELLESGDVAVEVVR